MSGESLKPPSSHNGEVKEPSAEGCIAWLALGGAAVSFALSSAGELAETVGVLPGLDFPSETFLMISGFLAVGSVAVYAMGKAWDHVQSRQRS